MADIEKRGRVFWTRLWVDGREIRRSLRTSDRSEARKRAQALREQLTAEAWHGEKRHTWRDVVVLWHQTALQGSVKPSTVQRYQVSAKALGPHFDTLWLDQINRKAIGKFVQARKAGGATNATVRRDLSALSRILAVAVANGWSDENPARTWDRSVIRERRDPIRPPLPHCIETVAKACPGTLGELVRFADMTGMRQEEAAALEWRDVDLKAGTVRLVKTKTSRPRVVRLQSPGGDARPILARLPRSLATPFVFVASTGDRYRQVATRFWEIVGGIDAPGFERFRFHDLRHGFAVRWLQSGGELFALSRHLGHTSVTTTEHYLRWVLRSEDRDDLADRAPVYNTGTTGD